jgi:hypothetical protein
MALFLHENNRKLEVTQTYIWFQDVGWRLCHVSGSYWVLNVDAQV